MGLRDKTEDEIFELVVKDNSLIKELEKLLEDPDKDIQKRGIMVLGRILPLSFVILKIFTVKSFATKDRFWGRRNSLGSR